jgi:hypothetical protein
LGIFDTWFLIVEWLCTKSQNTTDGSRWMVDVQPTKETALIGAAREARRRERLSKSVFGRFSRAISFLSSGALRAQDLSAFAFVG